jgi:acyl-phosphate glycerol 3-phosphate acyltransferase
MTQAIGVNILVVLFGYLIGSIPFAFIISKFRGIDIRERAIDGARGASLTWRNAGKVYGVLVAALDISKGVLSLLIAERLSGNPWIVVLAGFAAIIGHNWSLYMKFTGGKGAATTGGNLFYLLPREALVAILITGIPLLFVRKKKKFVVPLIKKEFRVSNFFSGVSFGTLFIVSLLMNGPSAYSFSPLIYAVPMFIKDYQMKKNRKKS